MTLLSILGYAAAILTTLSFLPQALKTIKEKNTDGISVGMYSMFTAGVLLWLIYGILIKDFPIILANSLTFFLAVTILFLKLKYSQKAKLHE
ncbi:SemiSWEET transporter [Bacillus sp. DJP31]|uniref:SemiSWEET transporter n=1 Tax=Bacillus sp. DJP31 TaxID=3409789 RepID=UPI003BB71C47